MKHIKKTVGNKPKHMIQGLLGIIDGLLRLLSFGWYWSNLQYTFVFRKL